MHVLRTLCTAATTGAHGMLPPPVPDSKTTLVHIVSYTLIPLVMLTMFIVTVYFCIRRYQYGELKHKHLQADVVQSTMPVVSTAANGDRLLVVAPPYSAHRPLLSSIGSIANVQKIEVSAVCAPAITHVSRWLPRAVSAMCGRDWRRAALLSPSKCSPCATRTVGCKSRRSSVLTR